MTTTKMTDDELRLSLHIFTDPDGFSVIHDYAQSEDLLERDIFPVIRERGKWKAFHEAVYDECVNRVGDPCVSRRELFDILLTLPARTLAEKACEVLKEAE